ncbi:hypothetical protein TNIN_337711 [Trichonephila inaurata madagascariensis]|uniref:Uncharacterized protein n=1 Tax=Trichonephila inaurata madagascariensis TaxID=2747483 RepID=A0A8X6K7T4_9ARAC|nr:hypothetical protein TNIN_337711 [Trichonephila inaurata madagascariensis]
MSLYILYMEMAVGKTISPSLSWFEITYDIKMSYPDNIGSESNQSDSKVKSDKFKVRRLWPLLDALEVGQGPSAKRTSIRNSLFGEQKNRHIGFFDRKHWQTCVF